MPYARIRDTHLRILLFREQSFREKRAELKEGQKPNERKVWAKKDEKEDETSSDAASAENIRILEVSIAPAGRVLTPATAILALSLGSLTPRDGA